MLEAVLVDYQSNIPQARDPEVLSLITAIINKLENRMLDNISDIFACVFECTIEMIQTNFQDYPDHRVNFFNLLRAINNYCFEAFLCIPADKFKLTIDAIVWAFKHTMRNVADTGLYILAELWENISNSEVADAFYKTYFVRLLQDVFFVLTEGSYKSGFAMQAKILLNMFYGIRTGKVTIPLWDVDSENYKSNEIFLLHFLANLIGEAFPNLSRQQVEQFVQGLFDKCNDLPAFKELLRDFLVEMKEWQGEDKNELYAEENKLQKQQNKEKMSQIPGMLKPSELEN
jgi:exportin-1